MVTLFLFVAALLALPSDAFFVPPHAGQGPAAATARWRTSKKMAHSAPQCTDLCAVSRKDFFKFSVAGAVAACTVAVPSSGLAVEELITASGLKIKKVKNGSGEKCEPGDLAAIRFRGKYKDFVFDDIFETPEPLYVRAGGAFLVKGMDEAMTMMRIGDYWELTLPGDLAFGDKGRPPSPGKPRIPPQAEIQYELELVGLPGKEGELFEALQES